MNNQQFIASYGRVDTQNGMVNDTGFARLYKEVRDRPDSFQKIFELATTYADQDPMGAACLVQIAANSELNTTNPLSTDEFKTIMKIAIVAVNAAPVTDRTEVVSRFMDSMSKFAGPDDKNLHLANLLYVMSIDGVPALQALANAAANYGDRHPNFIDFVQSEALRYKDTVPLQRTVGTILTRYADPYSDAFAHGVTEMAKPVVSGETTYDVLNAQLVALSRAKTSQHVNMLSQGFDGSINRRFGADARGNFFFYGMKLLDASPDKPYEGAVDYMSERFIECYFSMDDRLKDDMMTHFRQEEDTSPTYKGRDFGATIMGQAETRIRMIESGVDRDSHFRRRLEAKGLVPKVR